MRTTEVRPMTRTPQPLLPEPLRHPFAHLRARLAHWWQQRLPRQDHQLLTQRNVYILPTRPGFMLSATLLVLLVASINYQLNLGYLLTFLLAGSALVGMHLGHATLRGLTLLLHPTPATFAGSSATLDIELASTRGQARRGIGLCVLGTGQWVWTDVPAQGRARVQLAVAAPRRGLQPIPALTAETRFPLGTFRVWTLWRPASQLLVYPQPEPSPGPLPEGEPEPASAAAATRARTSAEFDGVRAYRRGDPRKLLVWKKMAKADEPLVRDSRPPQRRLLWLDLAATGVRFTQPGPALERALSRLCAWVLAAERLGLDYGLRLGAQAIAPAHGRAHQQQCLEALARYGHPAPQRP